MSKKQLMIDLVTKSAWYKDNYMPNERETFCNLIAEYYDVLDSVKDLRIGIKQINKDLVEHSRQELKKEAALYRENGDMELGDLLEYMASDNYLSIRWKSYYEFTRNLRHPFADEQKNAALRLELKQKNLEYEALIDRLKSNRLFSSQHPDCIFEIHNIKRYSHFTRDYDIHDFLVKDKRLLNEGMIDSFSIYRRNEDSVFELINSMPDITMDQFAARLRKCIDDLRGFYQHQRPIINDEINERYEGIGVSPKSL